jgi:RNA polymerase sigma factor for flagellar operon FliA
MVHGLAHRLRRELSLRSEIDDLVAFGFGGLLEAERRFDPARGVRFRTFAYYRVRGAMLDGVRKMAHLPRRAHERHQYEDEVELTAAPRSLDTAFLRISGSLTTGSVLQGELVDTSPEAALLKHESIARLLAALPRLSARHRTVVRAHYFEGRSLDDVARELGVSKSWASRLHTQALRRLREALVGAERKSAG